MLRVGIAWRARRRFVVVANTGVECPAPAEVEAVVDVGAPEVRVPCDVAIVDAVSLLEGVRVVVEEVDQRGNRRGAGACVDEGVHAAGKARERVEQVTVK